MQLQPELLPSLAFDEPEAPTPALPAVPLGVGSGRPRPFLMALTGSRTGEIFPVPGPGPTPGLVPPLVIGRGRGRAVDLHLPDDCVSRRHAEVRVVAPGLLRVRDLGSANGTYVRGRRVRTRLLRPGDRIEIGDGNLLRVAWLDPLEERFHRQLEEAALKDVLTAAYNRRYLRQRLSTELAFAQRHGTPVALLVIDVDHFKQVNDCFGHLTGDAILSELARTLLCELRGEDVLARWGGEEFAVLCHSTTDLPALVLGERIRHRVAATPFAHGQPLHVSIGIATYPQEGRPLLSERSTVTGAALADRLIGSADEALYHAKRMGRNQVVMSTEV